jgi:hypothetical protein
MSTPSVAYVAGGRLHVKLGEAPVRSFDSAFGQQVRDRHAEVHQRHSWKGEGRGARFMSGLLWGMPERDPALLRVAITSLTRGTAPGQIVYALDTEGRTAVCSFSAEDGTERRLLHGSAHRLADLRTGPGRDLIACSVLHPDMTAAIGVMALDATDLREVTEGDCHDRLPAWVPGAGRRIVYQSAGVGRDGAGRPAGLGPCEIHRLDLDDGALETLASEPGSDLISPRVDETGALYYVRRPYHGGAGKASFTRSLLDLVMLPARLLYAVFQYLNFFSARYTGKPLTTAGARQKGAADVRQMMVWSNLMEAERDGQGEEPAAVPKSWQLVRMLPGRRPETLAEGVLAFDLGDDGSVLYSTGRAIHALGAGGRHQRLLSEDRVEALVALS